jgi:hypothetical protein
MPQSMLDPQLGFKTSVSACGSRQIDRVFHENVASESYSVCIFVASLLRLQIWDHLIRHVLHSSGMIAPEQTSKGRNKIRAD